MQRAAEYSDSSSSSSGEEGSSGSDDGCSSSSSEAETSTTASTDSQDTCIESPHGIHRPCTIEQNYLVLNVVSETHFPLSEQPLDDVIEVDEEEDEDERGSSPEQTSLCEFEMMERSIEDLDQIDYHDDVEVDTEECGIGDVSSPKRKLDFNGVDSYNAKFVSDDLPLGWQGSVKHHIVCECEIGRIPLLEGDW